MDLKQAGMILMYIGMTMPKTKFLSETEVLHAPSKDYQVSAMIIPGSSLGSDEEFVLVISANANAKKNFKTSAGLHAWVREIDSRMPEGGQIAAVIDERNASKTKVLWNMYFSQASDDFGLWDKVFEMLQSQSSFLMRDIKAAGFN